MGATLEDVQVESQKPGVSVVRLNGEHDLANAGELFELLSSLLLESDLLLVDVSEAQFVDSSVLDVLLRVHKLANERGKEFRVQLGTEAIVERIFQISGVLDVLSWTSSRDAALNVSQAASSDEA